MRREDDVPQVLEPGRDIGFVGDGIERGAVAGHDLERRRAL
jgi:hypothetical protein